MDTGWITRIPIDRGAAPVVVGVVACASVVLNAGLQPRRWARWLVAGAAAMAVTVTVGKVTGIEHRVGSSFPPSFYLWVAFPVGGLLVAVAAPSRGGRVFKALSLGPTLLLALFGAVEVNAHYAYLPTIGDVVGSPMRDEVPQHLTSSILSSGSTMWAVSERSGRSALLKMAIPAPVSGFHARPGYVWLPPAFFDRPTRRFPVVVMVAGVPGDPSNLLRGGAAAAVADAFAASHGGVAPILVFPDHNGGFLADSECVDGPRGAAETYLTVDVPDFLAARFGSVLAPRPWGIVGYSEGGTCALTLSLRHPSLFGSFVDIGGGMRPSIGSTGTDRRHTIDRLYGGRAAQWSDHDPMALLAARPPVRGVLVAGSLDRRPAMVARHLVARAARLGLSVQLLTVPGGHSFEMVRKAIAATFPSLATQLLIADGEHGRERLTEPSLARTVPRSPRNMSSWTLVPRS